MDDCDLSDAASELDEVFVEPDEEGFEAQASIRHESKINPNTFLFDDDEKKVKVYAQSQENPLDVAKDSDISKLITDGIRAAEELEQSILERERSKILNKTLSLNLEESMTFPNTGKIHEKGIPVPFDIPIQQTQPGLPVFLRPPISFPKGPILRPIKGPYRRPISFERRPVQHRSPPRPAILPQQSMIVNHYKKPVANPLVRTVVKSNKPPIPSIASVLLLGEPTEISAHHYSTPPSVHIQKPKNSHILDFQSYPKNKEIPLLFPQKEKSSNIQYYEKPVLQRSSPKVSYEKKTIEYRRPDFSSAPSTNFGFQPDSVVVESGFRPIIRREDKEEEIELDDNKNRRQDDLSEIEESPVSDIGFVEPEKKTFEPMFIPSPLDNVNIGGRFSSNNRREHLSGDLIDMDVEDGEDKIAVAAERQESYYLPPFNKRPGQVYPEGTVVAYDGKAVLDTSLINSGPIPQSIGSQIYADVSRTEQLIRDTPQFAPFRGEIPPLGQDYIQQNGVQFQLNRDPNPVTEYFNPLNHPKNSDPHPRPISTKLTLHRSDNNNQNSRIKRAAAPHHTPDHHGDEHDQEHYDHAHMNSSSKSNAALNINILTHLAFLSYIAMILFKKF